MEPEKLQLMADTYTEGYRIGFIKGNKDLSKKKVAQIVYPIGFEQIVKLAIDNFKKMGLDVTMMRTSHSIFTKRGTSVGGYYSESPNKQYEYDHREDEALFLDKKFVSRRLEVQKEAYEQKKELSAVHAGPAWIEVFGETPFTPVLQKEACQLSKKQQELSTWYYGQLGQIINSYIPGEERSFTIIAYPIPEIGEDFPEIFREIVKINTLDYKKYQKIQQTIIDTLDTCEWVEIKGKGENETDLLIHLHTLTDAKTQTNFENCVADVNIPLGEVFTSPVLAGTGGMLHVSKVYLNGLQFCDLKLVFDCGQVIDYSCSNFETEEENRKYIEDNILFHHPKLAMGEFAQNKINQWIDKIETGKFSEEEAYKIIGLIGEPLIRRNVEKMIRRQDKKSELMEDRASIHSETTEEKKKMIEFLEHQKTEIEKQIKILRGI